MQWKRLQAQVTGLEECRLKLEEDLKKARAEAEAGIRAIAEKSEMVSRLSALDNVQRENVALRNRVQMAIAKEKQFTKRVSLDFYLFILFVFLDFPFELILIYFCNSCFT